MYDSAIKELNNFISAYPSSPYVVNAHFLIAGSCFYLKQFDKTLEITVRIRNSFPSSKITDKVLFLEGRAYFQLKKYNESISTFNKMVLDYRTVPIHRKPFIT